MSEVAMYAHLEARAARKEIRQRHGWTNGFISGTGVFADGEFWVADAIDPLRQCGCDGPIPCQREATQEDLLCDQCRDWCGTPDGGDR